MKRQLYLPLLITLLASLIFGVLPLGQLSTVYAAPDTETLRPNAAGDYQEWALVDTTHYGATSDQSDTSYIQTTGVSTNRDVQNLTDPTFYQGSKINSVTYYIRATATGSGAKERLYIMEKLGVSERTTSEAITRVTWNDYSVVQTTAPDTLDWTYQKVIDLQAGIQVDTLDDGETLSVSEIWVVVDYTPPSISNTPNTWAFGTVSEGSSYETGITYVVDSTGFRITNNVAYDVNITISATDMGSGWLLADSGDPDATHYTLWAGTELTSPDYNIQVTSGGTSLITVLASSTRDWGLKLMTPTSFADGGLKSGTVTLTATQA